MGWNEAKGRLKLVQGNEKALIIWSIGKGDIPSDVASLRK